MRREDKERKRHIYKSLLRLWKLYPATRIKIIKKILLSKPLMDNDFREIPEKD